MQHGTNGPNDVLFEMTKWFFESYMEKLWGSRGDGLGLWVTEETAELKVIFIENFYILNIQGFLWNWSRRSNIWWGTLKSSESGISKKVCILKGLHNFVCFQVLFLLAPHLQNHAFFNTLMISFCDWMLFPSNWEDLT